ncbi:MAG TPA: hypothetical protein VKE29_00655 [Candidatus Udaeobacter sp.]|nr:hypothetical protein [Candidatus Udaeobacter sp.]
MFSSGLVFAEENSAFSSRTSTTAESGFNLGYGNEQMSKYGIHERIIDRLGLFDRSDNGQSSRYNVELDLENEDSDWSFEVTVTVEF